MREAPAPPIAAPRTTILSADVPRARHDHAKPGPAREPVQGAGFLRALFWLADHAPRCLGRCGPWLARCAWYGAPVTRRALRLNAARLRPDFSPRQRDALGRAVLRSFIRFITDLAQAQRMSPARLSGMVEATEGIEHYEAARALRRGTIVVTAHLGSFEVGMATIASRERDVWVVFARDVFSRFEAMRRRVREALGVREARIEVGWPMWLELRDALSRDAVVMMQGDRLMPGQKGEDLPFLSGHMGLPTGPVRLAQLSGAPILPVFSIRQPNGQVRIIIDPPIELDPADDPVATRRRAMRRLAALLQTRIAQHPEQWLMLQPAWREDQPAGHRPEGA